jgi:uncharacterized iron-regulated membrane protein
LNVRKVLFWSHLTAGVVAGSVILIMSVTGVLLTFQQSVLGIVERSQRTVAAPAAGTSRMDLDALLAQVRLATPDAQPTTVTLESDPLAAGTVALGTQGTVFVNPYTGQVLGSGSPRARAFYRSVTNWHRYLALDGEQRAVGRAITGACNVAFLVLAVSGLYLWWPRQWTWRHVSAVLLFRSGLRGKARDFNWHNVFGVWCGLVIVILTTTAMVISYTWATNLLYTLTGSPRPAQAVTRPAAPANESRQGAGPRGDATARQAQRPQAAAAALQPMLAEAERQVPTWRTIIMRLPPRAGGPVSISISDRAHWNSFARSTITIDGTTGAVGRWEPYAASSLGQKVRGWMRFAHTGELGGLPGEAVAGLASAGGVFLVWTGISLALRRFFAWRARRRAVRAVVPVEPIALPVREEGLP